MHLEFFCLICCRIGKVFLGGGKSGHQSRTSRRCAPHHLRSSAAHKAWSDFPNSSPPPSDPVEDGPIDLVRFSLIRKSSNSPRKMASSCFGLHCVFTPPSPKFGQSAESQDSSSAFWCEARRCWWWGGGGRGHQFSFLPSAGGESGATIVWATLSFSERTFPDSQNRIPTFSPRDSTRGRLSQSEASSPP